MWDHRCLYRIDFRIIPVLAALMFVSLLVMSSVDFHASGDVAGGVRLFSPFVKSQLRSFFVGSVAFIFYWYRIPAF